MDVSEVDAAVLSSSSFIAGIGGIGAGFRNTTGEVGNVAGTLNYEELPTIRYQPLLGQALISQLSTPITVDSLANLVNSGWGPSTALELALDRITPTYTSRTLVLNAMQKLWTNGALIITAEKKQKSESHGSSGSQNDSLVLYYNAKAAATADVPGLADLWNKLQEIYKGTQDEGTPPNEIVLRTKPGNTPGKAPIIQTQSALGILKEGFEYGRFMIVSKEQYAKRTKHPNLEDCWSLPGEDATSPFNQGHYLL
jgi:hypothetical protein